MNKFILYMPAHNKYLIDENVFTDKLEFAGLFTRAEYLKLKNNYSDIIIQLSLEDVFKSLQAMIRFNSIKKE